MRRPWQQKQQQQQQQQQREQVRDNIFAGRYGQNSITIEEVDEMVLPELV